jgi:aldehyde:ferredoxin oxidoreductase
MRLCNYYGLDGISTGVVIGFAMDLFEHEIITKEQTDGIDLRFGNGEALIQMVKKIGLREGWLADVLAEGTMRAAEKIGNGAEQYACHIKGLELPGYDIRGLKTAALGFSVSFRGGCHLRNGAYSPDVKGKVNRFTIENGRGKLIMEEGDVYNIIDSLIVCKFSRGTYYDGLQDMAKYYSLATGIPMTAAELRKAGERIENLARLYNLREGIGTREYDTLPPKIMTVPIPDDGVAKGVYVNNDEFQLGLDDYYSVRGWTKEGIPTTDKLNELDLREFAYMTKRGEA